MARWQRRARLVLAVIFVGVIAAVFLFMRQRTTLVQVTRPDRIDPTAVAETRGGEVVQFNTSRQDVKIEFASQVTYEDGRTKLTGFKANVANRGGRSYVIGGQEAFVGSERLSYDVRGKVSLQTSDGMLVTTEQATFTEAEGLLRGDGPVQFKRENMSGSGVGFRYERPQDAIWLLDQAVIRFAPTRTESGMEITAPTGNYSRLQRYARFERGVRITRDTQIIEADDCTVFMQPQLDEPDRIELRGNSRITGGSQMGALQSMTAPDINLDYAADGRTLEQAVLTGGSNVQLAQPDGTPGQQLSAINIDLSLAPDGAVTKLVGRESVRMVLPTTADTPAREITAHTLDGTGEPKKGLTTISFEGAPMTELHEKTADGERVARGRFLKAQLSSAGTVETATFSAGFRFADGPLRAASGDAQYNVTKGSLTISSPKGDQKPRVETQIVSIDAPSIDVTLSPRRMSASGGVATTLSAQRRQAGERGLTLLKDSEPVALSAEGFTYDEQAGRSEYKGKALLLQGTTSIRSDALVLDDRQGLLNATGNVVAVLPISGTGAGGKETATSTARAGGFEFVDAARKATFNTQAQLDGAQGNIRAEKIELVLAPKDNALDRLEAQGGVVRVVVEKREASGTRLTYLPATEEYKLGGMPVRLVEGGCRETTGRTLTFFRSSDRLIVDGNEEVRTQTRGNSKCPESP